MFHVCDADKDIVQNGAFTETIQLRGKQGWPVLVEHSAKKNLGKTSRVVQNHMGLYVAVYIPITGNLASDVLIDLKLGLLKGLSIGYHPKNWSKDENGNRLLHSVNLLEISLVKEPSNDMCGIDRWHVIEDTST